ncbi:MAG: thiamine-phosphate kinase [Elusimicrobia bacterium]|nr:thiamine-phosphate kinase [Elusimicrobiota bacterium]MBD3412221.1 thiamine-phosphate kinase [Elusimicrobiota bacterium]
MQPVSSIGEQELITKAQHLFQSKKNSDIVIPNGDDACAVRMGRSKISVLTVDMLCEDVHFKGSWNRWVDIGYKAVMVNVSDCAAMGDVRPLFALVSMGMHKTTPVDIVDKLLTGMRKACVQTGIRILGGDTVRSAKHMVISICLLGSTVPNGLVKRSGAQVGDKVLISGPCGLAGAGLDILMNQGCFRKKITRVYAEQLIQAHLCPPDRLGLGSYLGKSRRATSMIDASDGLAVSLEHLCTASQLGMRIDVHRLPVPRNLQTYADATGKNLHNLILHGGEDYELVFTARPNSSTAITDKFKSARIIGEVVPGRNHVSYYMAGRSWHSSGKRFNHF